MVCVSIAARSLGTSQWSTIGDLIHYVTKPETIQKFKKKHDAITCVALLVEGNLHRQLDYKRIIRVSGGDQ